MKDLVHLLEWSKNPIILIKKVWDAVLYEKQFFFSIQIGKQNEAVSVSFRYKKLVTFKKNM